MEYISSDTNFWIDFSAIDRIELPFRLPYTYIMNQDAIEKELLSPPGLGKVLIAQGLIPVELSEEEFDMAERIGMKYAKLSTFDIIALSIAKVRGITLLTGDKALRRAAKAENVDLLGTLGILDMLEKTGSADKSEIIYCLQALLCHQGKEVRLPKLELESRLKRFLDEL